MHVSHRLYEYTPIPQAKARADAVSEEDDVKARNNEKPIKNNWQEAYNMK